MTNTFTSREAKQVPLVPVLTFVLWTTCALIGILGWWMPYPRPHAPGRSPPPVIAQRITVDISQEPSVPQANASAAAAPQIAQPPQTPSLPAIATETPSLTAVAPLQAPTQPAPPQQAAVQHLVYGQGEGQQPAPEYPREAVLARQQGTVVVRFTVDQEGQVLDAQPVAPSPWPLLNQAAVRAIRDTWRFRAGSMRCYEVSIQFVLR